MNFCDIDEAIKYAAQHGNAVFEGTLSDEQKSGMTTHGVRVMKSSQQGIKHLLTNKGVTLASEQRAVA